MVSTAANSPLSLQALLLRWREEASLLRRRGQESLAALAESYAEELEVALQTMGTESLELEVAARESGYSTQHLSRLIRRGRLVNAGTDHRPRILRRDLPRKPPTVARTGPSLQVHRASPSQVARALRQEPQR